MVETILTAAEGSTVKPDAVSRLEYDCGCDSHFQVLSDECTVVGVRLENNTVVTKENIANHSARVVNYTAASNEVFTLVVDESANLLLAGQYYKNQGRVVQYCLDTTKVVKDYSSLGIGAIVSSARLGNLCFFGGWESSSVAAVDTLEQKVLGHPVKTAMESIYSVAMCETRTDTVRPKTVLSVAGLDIDYSTGRPDLLDVTALVKTHSRHKPAESLSQRNALLEAEDAGLTQNPREAQPFHKKALKKVWTPTNKLDTHSEAS